MVCKSLFVVSEHSVNQVSKKFHYKSQQHECFFQRTLKPHVTNVYSLLINLHTKAILWIYLVVVVDILFDFPSSLPLNLYIHLFMYFRPKSIVNFLYISKCCMDFIIFCFITLSKKWRFYILRLQKRLHINDVCPALKC